MNVGYTLWLTWMNEYRSEGLSYQRLGLKRLWLSFWFSLAHSHSFSLITWSGGSKLPCSNQPMERPTCHAEELITSVQKLTRIWRITTATGENLVEDSSLDDWNTGQQIGFNLMKDSEPAAPMQNNPGFLIHINCELISAYCFQMLTWVIHYAEILAKK